MARKNWQSIFINELAESSNVKQACEAAGVSQSLVYKTRREKADFARQWYAALTEGYDNLEMDLLLHPAIEAEASDPPASAAEGEGWLVGPAASGAWSGREGMLTFARASS